MEGSGDALKAMDGVVERGGNAVDRQKLLPEVTEAGAAPPADVDSDRLPYSDMNSGRLDVAQQPEKSEMGIVLEILTVEDRAIFGREGVKVCAEKVEERGDGEGGGKGKENAAETVEESGVGENGGPKEDGADMAEKEGAGGQNKKDGDYTETGKNDSGRDRGLPSEEDEELEDFEGEEDDREGEDEEEEEALGEDREGRYPMTPSSEPLDAPPSNLTPPSDRNTSEFTNGGYYDEEEDEDEEEEGNEDDEDDDSEANAQPLLKKQKSLISLTTETSKFPSTSTEIPENLQPPVGSSTATASTTASKKSKKKNSNVWRKSASRKGKKKGKSVPSNNLAPPEDKVFITPIPRFPDRSDDSPDATICLSKVYKAEKVELSDDRLTAGSTKGYRMVRATRGVIEGTWYFEINVLRLGETGHTRLGWTTEKGDLQAPVGYDGNSYGYRDIDGTKIHRALREKYGDEGYVEGDVIGFYINLPDGESYAPKPPHLVWYKGQRYMYSADAKDDPPKVIPGSEITFFKNGKCQGTAFTDLYGGRYYPAASMYTLPNQPNCEVRFNFGPEFQCFPKDFGGRPTPRPMIEAPYHGYANKVEGPSENGTTEKQANGVSS